MDWSDEYFSHAREGINWLFPDITPTSLESHQPLAYESDSLPSLTASTPVVESGGALTLPHSDSETLLSGSNMSCQCRSLLISHIPELECNIQERPSPRLDRMLKVTEDVIGSCQAAVSCSQCQLGPVDLVFIVTIFQQTAACFNHIIKSGLDGAMKVGLGDYEVSLIDGGIFKRMLVVNLVKQANKLLDTLGTLSQNFLTSQEVTYRKVMNRSPACLTLANLSYVREVIANFKKFFDSVMEMFNENMSD
jgi:hypothetical protein